MLTQADKDKLKALGLDPDKLISAVTAETETSITIPEGQILSESDLTARDEQTKKSVKSEYEANGKKIGFEIANKTIIDKFGLKDVTKSDEPSKIADALNTVIAGGDTDLKKRVDDLIKDKDTLSQQLEQANKQADSIRFEYGLTAKFPKNRVETLTDSDFLMLIKNDIEEVDGVKGIKVNGEVLRDSKTRAVLPVDQALESYFTSRKWIVESAGGGGGRGGKNNSGGGGGSYRTYSEAEKTYIEQNNGDVMAIARPEFKAYIAELAKSPDFDMNA